MKTILKNKSFLVLTAIVLLGFFLRVYQLGSLPVILNRDEAALAYNAYLLKETGSDEWSRTWPLTLESFGDFKLPGYPVVLVLLFSVVGVSDLVVRLPSALAGTGLILLSYWWVKKLKLGEIWSLLAALIVAVTPIFWFYSRIAFEANLGLTLFVAAAGLILFYQNKKFDFLSILLFLFSCLTYNTPLLLLPFLVALIPLVRGVKQWKKWVFPTLGLLIVFMGLFISFFPLTSQKSGITIFSDETIWMETVTYREQFSGLAQTLLGNKYIYFLQLMVIGFIRSFSPVFMVTSGGTHPWHSIPDGGHISWLVYGAGLWGIVLSIKQYLQRKSFSSDSFLLIYLLVIALAPSVITVDAPHATRSLFFFFIFTVLAVKGLSNLASYLKPAQRNMFKTLVLLAVVGSGLLFLQNYFIWFALNQPESLYPGFDRAIQEVEEKHPQDQVAIVDTEGYHYILAAWYLKTEPELFQQTIVKQLPNQIGFRYGERFDHFHFIGAEADAQIEQEKVILYWNGTEWRIMDL